MPDSHVYMCSQTHVHPGVQVTSVTFQAAEVQRMKACVHRSTYRQVRTGTCAHILLDVKFGASQRGVTEGVSGLGSSLGQEEG